MKQLFLLVLLILAACETAVQTVPSSNYTPSVFEEPAPEIDPCADKTCPAGQTCSNGICGCETGKLCGKTCIPNNACCTNSDCVTQNCVNGTCAPAKECSIGEQLEDGECVCSADFIKCPEQGKCIKKGSCCYHGNCPRFNRCQPTTYRSSICIVLGEKKVCRTLGEQRNSEFYQLGNSTFNTDILAWLSTGDLRVRVNGQNLTLRANKTEMLNGAKLYQEGIDILGGNCEPDEDDD